MSPRADVCITLENFTIRRTKIDENIGEGKCDEATPSHQLEGRMFVEKLLFSRCHLNRKDLQLRVNRASRITKLFSKEFHASCSQTRYFILLFCIRQQRPRYTSRERAAAGNGGEALSIFRFLHSVYEAEDEMRIPSVPFFFSLSSSSSPQQTDSCQMLCQRKNLPPEQTSSFLL